MRNRYLEILELSPGATEVDIKKAYRRLSKKYHPDVRKDTSSRDRFIEITEAYDFLLDVGPNPHNETVTYDYDPEVSEYDSQRAWARKKAEERARERERNSQKVDRFLRISNWIALFLTSLFIVDLVLPKRPVDVIVLWSFAPREYSGRSNWKPSTEIIKIVTSEGSIEISSDFSNKVRRGETGILGKSFFLGLNKYYISSTTKKKYSTVSAIFRYFIVLPIFSFITSIIALRTKSRSVLWNFGSAALVMVPIAAFLIWKSM